MNERRTLLRRGAALLLALGAAGLSGLSASCSQTPPNNPVRTFERPEQLDVVCMKVRDRDEGSYVPPQPAPLSECTALSAEDAITTGAGELRAYHLYALVTQTSRGEVAVADLTGGYVVDHDRVSPSINFLTVGSLPRDIAATPDGELAFVTSAEPNKAALYAIETRKMLGDWLFPAEKTTLASWPSCSLPSAPTSVAVLRDDGIAGSKKALSEATVAVLLPGTAGNPSKIVTMDARAFFDAPKDGYAGPLVGRGSLGSCPVLGVIELSGGDAVPAEAPRGPEWDDGVKYRAEAAKLPDPGPLPAGESSKERLPFAKACFDAATKPDGTPASVKLSFAESLKEEKGRATRFVKDGTRLYVADAKLPVIHVVDVSDPKAPKELPSLVATSLQDPSRLVTVKSLALSPETRDYRRYLYAVDEKQGSIMVFDVSREGTTSRYPLTRPNAQSNPFEPLDRIELDAPVVSVQFARHEAPIGGRPLVSGALCNPNPSAAQSPGAGLLLSEDAALRLDLLGPARLRGVFAIATLTNGRVVTLDVDDWDAPCRRPFDLASQPSATTPPQPAPAAGDLDPYHAPLAEGVTGEVFFPVSAPHRVRSEYYLADVKSGERAPYIQQMRLTSRGDTSLALNGAEGRENPKIVAPGVEIKSLDELDKLRNDKQKPLGFVGFSKEDPTVVVDQGWVTQFEGSIPTLDGALATLATEDDFQSLTLTAEGAHFCSHGVEDLDQGRARVDAFSAELATRELPVPPNLSQRVVDYVEIVDDLLPPTDPYWLEDQACWTGDLAKASATQRFAVCNQTFDGDFEPPPEVNPEPLPNPNRHFPILEAYDGKLRVSRFYAKDALTPRVAVRAEATNQKSLALAKCCFHNQARFRVRTGMQWMTKGESRDQSPVQFLHHVVRAKDDRCVQSCESRVQLLNARAITIPRPTGTDGTAPDRNSALAMRNPMFSFSIFSGVGRADPVFGTTFKYATRGRFVPLTRSLSSTTTAVSPRSMRYIGPLGQMAIVDGAAQGLVLFDLRTVSLGRTNFF